MTVAAASKAPAAPPTTFEQPTRDDVMIRTDGLGKKFKIYPKPWGRFAEWLTGGNARRHDDFWALRDVSFELRRGESLGVIGVNGSGKSTLLKILSGAMYPTEGTFDVRGRVLSLLELGTGVNPQLTGRQNVINSARLLAFPPGYVSEKMGEIEAFAELGEFFDRPVRLYSSGMLVRLVFSMFACFDPDVFVVDEALSVGDLYFQQKCARRIRAMLDAGVTMLFVSHDLAAVEALCQRVMLLHQGRVRHLGDKAVGIRMYFAVSGAAMASAPAPAPAPSIVNTQATSAAESPVSTVPDDVVASLGWQRPDARDAIGNGHVRLAGVAFRRDDGSPEPVVEQNQWLDVYAKFVAEQDVWPVNFGVTIFDRMGRVVFGRGWINADVEPVKLSRGQELVARVRLRMDLEPDEYVVCLVAAEPLRDDSSPNGWNQDVGGTRYAELPRACRVAVLPRGDRRKLNYGPARLPSEFGYSVK
jgi:ABC-type polysaccharide/polyol phosphate transport system ATPase subunit